MKSGNKALLALAIAALTSSNAFADVDGGSGKITFTGTIINAPCAIQAEDIDKQVQLGEVPASYINTNGHSDAVDSSLHLINCDLPNSDNGSGVPISKVDVTFNSDSVTTEDSSLLSNTFAGGAQNVGVRLLDSSSTNITLGTAKTIDLITDSKTQILPFMAYMQKVGTTDVTVGAVAATATYKLTYK
ncbi:fimbrial protein [Citrobacter freundii]|uniref:fimbrial protein n=1 Tax=Citrobacter freundii TaxID=546 RepID=UPI0022AE1711|nr:fimbrial protein [Citrobacter freundii]ELL8667506.1 fimbrial protein [Citrobacter freundii]MDE8821763.1 fimbrial protein [Citrobacter freundii]HCU2472152.1 fimbrial protein [Citrobacter freundii]